LNQNFALEKVTLISSFSSLRFLRGLCGTRVKKACCTQSRQERKGKKVRKEA